MIHEDRLHQLSESEHSELRRKGYLAPIYALLFSVNQLNALIRRHNSHQPGDAIVNINLEVSKDLQNAGLSL